MIELLENVNLDGFVAVLPSVCVGNVAQLASDLLIFNLNLKKLGYVWHPDLLTFVGADPFGRNDGPSTACEVFFSSSLNLMVFQVRSAFIRIDRFTKELCAWLKMNKVKRVVILSGSSAQERRDKQLFGEPLRYVFCPLMSIEESQNARNRNWIELEKKEIVRDLSHDQSTLPSYIPGSGMAVKLFNNCIKERIPCAILLNFCSDGDNVPDALKLVNYMNDWFRLKEKQKITNWIIPPSWNLLFGSHPPTEIFN